VCCNLSDMCLNSLFCLSCLVCKKEKEEKSVYKVKGNVHCGVFLFFFSLLHRGYCLGLVNTGMDLDG